MQHIHIWIRGSSVEGPQEGILVFLERCPCGARRETTWYIRREAGREIAERGKVRILAGRSRVDGKQGEQ